jgi:hypothetical protein
MPHYLLSICYPTDATRPDDDTLARIMEDVGAINADMIAAGSWVFSGGLHDPSTATVVTENAGGLVMSDGPFIEAKEQVGGITIVDAADLDAALGWASRLTAAMGIPIEVRPFEHAWTR